MQIRYQHVQAYPGIGQNLMQTILLCRQHADHLLTIVGDQTRFPNSRLRNERGAK